MPIYEYRCAKCGHTFERMQKFSDPPVTKCPECKGKVEKLLSPPGLLFKGTGWYVTDYSDSRKKAAAAEKGAAENGGGKAPDKAEKSTERAEKGSNKAENRSEKAGKTAKDKT